MFSVQAAVGFAVFMPLMSVRKPITGYDVDGQIHSMAQHGQAGRVTPAISIAVADAALSP
ncbi:hypothetical protein WMF04_48370 [Sorangium sp. So ce260]|uniref:hypothetical protein n=1 Tax=Sorangium sp. So ce260 TaxID=3133291 RepID=UPI003F64748C